MNFFRKHSRALAAILGLNLLAEWWTPNLAFALTSGPSQPEVQNFQPIGTTDIVNPFSGDFSYNIPLLDIDGYPINIAYSSGISSDQEASWVGLGWNINVGGINRSMRGIPDEFNGDEIVTESHMRENVTVGGSISANAESELFGKKINGLKLSASLGVNYNNYNGFGIETSVHPSINAGQVNQSKFEVGLGLTNSTSCGLSIKPSLGINRKDVENSSRWTSVGSASLAYNSLTGLSQLSIWGSPNVIIQGNPRSVDGGINFGLPTYTPHINMPMLNFNYSIWGKVDAHAIGLSIKTAKVTGYESAQMLNLKQHKLVLPAFGYMNSQNVPRDNKGHVRGMMDLNRTWDGSFNKNTPALPVTSYTFDIFSATGQGVSGTFRPYRNDLSSVYDNHAQNVSAGASVGTESGTGQLFSAGLDISANYSRSESGNWAVPTSTSPGSAVSYSNSAAMALPWETEGDDLSFEAFAMREMGELSVDDEPSLFEAIGGSQASRIELTSNGQTDFEVRTAASLRRKDGTLIPLPGKNYRKKRIKRNQTLTLIRFDELSYKGLNSNDDRFFHAPGHHVAEMVLTRNDGVRYYYGVPAYNTVQEELTFNVGMDLDGLTRTENIQGHKASLRGEDGMFYYNYDNANPNKGDNSIGNRRGVDHYFNATKMPAFAYSHLLSAVLSPDYVDVDNVRGPSAGDIGNYTVFKYKKSDRPYKWRTPFGNGEANYQEGLRSDFFDDKASYVYGEKEIWYLDRIETKNTIAIFTLENRKDAWESAGRNGGFGDQSMKLLRKISLYSKPEYDKNPSTAIPIKEVHFVYDYSLCPKTANNIEMTKDLDSPDFDLASSGKLTLKRIYFTYGASTKSAFSPYSFQYNEFNPEYGIKNSDRWGTYKPNEGTYFDVSGSKVPNPEFPYTEQHKPHTDLYAAAWTLKKINLPSGGSISIVTESDDYAYVQNKRAMQMFKVIGAGKIENGNLTGVGNKLMNPASGILGKDNNTCLVFKLSEEITPGGNTQNEFIRDYLKGIDELYFRFLVDITGKGATHNEYISGFAEIEKDANGQPVCGLRSTTGGNYDEAWVKVKEVDMGDKAITADVHPISKATWHFARINAPQMVYNREYPETPSITKFFATLGNASFTNNLLKTILGANGYLKQMNSGFEFVAARSFIRLNNPDGKKLGGGLRVKRVIMNDEWDDMVIGNESQSYGQEYDYTTQDEITGKIISSGVAAWEPAIGGDENPHSLPVWQGDKDENLLTPDNKSYLTGPAGEAFYPSPGVGYSKVTVRNLQGNNVGPNGESVKRHATGWVVNEYYTARDFPTISEYTTIDVKRRRSNPVWNFLKIDNRDYMTASQGYVIELNDMHGKQKAMWIYAEDQDKPISGVEYMYQSMPYLENSKRLTNHATVVYPDGSYSTRPIGLEYDFVTDFREYSTVNIGGGFEGNISTFLAAYFPIVGVTVYPNITRERTRFRSAVVTKVINRYGILAETIAHDLGSKVSTKNLAYDAETGLVLLTQTKNNFEDDIYTFNYPAHWHYDAMGQAYKNLGIKFRNVAFNSNGEATITGASGYFVPGDEVLADNIHAGWVKSVSGNTVTIINEMGKPYMPGTTALNMSIIRSGRRNMIGVSMGSITSLENPLPHLRTGKFEKVLNSSAQVFKEQWRTFCECFDGGNSYMKSSQNQYAIGNKGLWRAYKSWAYLVEREHTWKNNNTNIRRDGVYSSFNPFWHWNGLQWEADATNWTWTSEITEISPYGAELENVDALGRYSAAIYGYNNTTPTAVAANARYSDIATDGFEDYDFRSCSDDHFSYKPHKVSVSTAESHTGKRSISVSSGSSLTISRKLSVCDSE